MIYISIDGKKIPSLGYGTWQLKENDCIIGVSKALEVGYRHIDTAQIYGNESEVGTALQSSGIPREDIFLTTKVWIENFAEKDLKNSVEISLEKLKTDYVNLLLIHWPVEEKASFAEQMKALQAVKEAGQTQLIGISNFTVAQMKEVSEDMGVRLVNNQVEYHPYLSQKPVLDYIRAHDMFMTAYCPLARGRVAEDPLLIKIAEKYNKTAGQVALRWLVQQKNVVAIPKAGSEKHIQENFDIFDFNLEENEMTEIAGLSKTDGRLIKPDWSPKWDIAA